MKHLKLFEDHSDLSKNFYVKFYIKELTERFDGKVTVDKIKKIEPLYGGGNYVYIGYKVELKDNEKFDWFILEGLQLNGFILDPSILIDNMIHGMLDIKYSYSHYSSKGRDYYMEELMDLIEQYLKKS